VVKQLKYAMGKCSISTETTTHNTK